MLDRPHPAASEDEMATWIESHGDLCIGLAVTFGTLSDSIVEWIARVC
jgi:hypothetical protein